MMGTRITVYYDDTLFWFSQITFLETFGNSELLWKDILMPQIRFEYEMDFIKRITVFFKEWRWSQWSNSTSKQEK